MSTSSLFGGPNSLAFKTFNVVFLGVPGYLDRKFNMTPEAQTQRLGELAAQTAKEGVARPIVWGRARPIGGNLIYVQSPVIKKEKQKAPSSGGKGGSKKAPDTYVERVYRSYAIRICEGPATGVIRIWRNNKLVYDARGNEWGAKNNGVFLKKARLYLGGWAQMPDPTLQSIWGAANVPAHRGTCYMVIINEDLTDMGGSVPQYLFEVERAEGIGVTSKPYPIETSETTSAVASVSQLLLKDQVITVPIPGDAVSVAPSVTSLSLNDHSPKPVEFIYIAPGVFKLAFPKEAKALPEYIAVMPSVTRLYPSITYDKQLFEGVSLIPSCTELTLV